MLNNYPDILNVKQLCEILCICETTAYKLLSSGEIKSVRIGTRHKILKSSVIEYLNT